MNDNGLGRSLCFALIVFALLTLGVCAGLTRPPPAVGAAYAPAPFGPPKKKAPLVVSPGLYVMVWRGTVCSPTYFHENGMCCTRWNGSWWSGTWKCKNGWLHVDERNVALEGDDGHGPRCSWDVQLASPLHGTMSGGTAWKLVPVRKRVD